MYSDSGSMERSIPKCSERNFEDDIERAGKVLSAKAAMQEAMEDLKKYCGVHGDTDYRRAFFMIYGDIVMSVSQDEARIINLIKEQEAYIKRNAKK